MAPLFRLLALCLLLNLSLPAVSAEQVSKDDLDAHKELLQLKIDSGKESVQKDIEALGKRQEAIDKRIDDQVNRFGDLGFFAGILATLITVILAALGMLGYFSVASRAKETSEDVAGKTAEKWFADHQGDLRAQITQIQSTSQQVQAEVETLQHAAKAHHEEVAALRTQMEAELSKLQALTARGERATLALEKQAENEEKAMQEKIHLRTAIEKSNQSVDQTASNNPGLEWRVAELDNTPDREKDFNYWNTHAFAAYAKNDFATAAKHWQQAAAVEAAPPAQAAQALNNAGFIQWQQGGHEAALKTYEQVIAEYSTDTHPEIREQVARAMTNKGGTQGQLGHLEDALKTCEQVIAEYSVDTHPKIREQVIGAMVNKGVAQEKLGQLKEALETYDHVIAVYGTDTHPEIHQQVISAMVNKGVAQEKLGQLKEALETYDQVIAKHGADTHPEIHQQVARAMVNKGVTQQQLDERDKVLETWNQVIARFGSDTSTEIRLLVSGAMNGKAFVLLLGAKVQLAANPAALVQAALNEAQELLKQALEHNPGWGIALGNLAYVQWLLQQPAAAESSFRQALLSKEDGGEALYRATLDDIAQHPIPADQGFRELIGRLWLEHQSQASGAAPG